MGKAMNIGAAMLGSYDTPAGHVAAAPSKKPDHKGTVVESINIECTDNGGYSVTVHRSSKSSTGSPYIKPGKHVFEDKTSLDDFLDSVLGTADHSGK